MRCRRRWWTTFLLQMVITVLYLADTEQDWTPICPFEKSTKIVARITNRMLVGLPLCIHLPYFTLTASRQKRGVSSLYREKCPISCQSRSPSQILSRNPQTVSRSLAEIDNSLVSLFFVGIRRCKQVSASKLAPIIEQRRTMMKDPNCKKPVDVLQWLMESAQGDETKTSHLCARIQTLNFAAIHTTSIVVHLHQQF